MRLPVSLILLLLFKPALVSGGGLSPESTVDTQPQKRFCAGPNAGETSTLCARLKAAGNKGPIVPAGAPLTYASRRPTDGTFAQIDLLDIVVSEITGTLATQYQVTQSISGVVVTKVGIDGAAERAGVGVGDVLIELNQEPIDSPDGLARQLEALNAANVNTALLLSYRNYKHHFQTIAID